MEFFINHVQLHTTCQQLLWIWSTNYKSHFKVQNGRESPWKWPWPEQRPCKVFSTLDMAEPIKFRAEPSPKLSWSQTWLSFRGGSGRGQRQLQGELQMLMGLPLHLWGEWGPQEVNSHGEHLGGCENQQSLEWRGPAKLVTTPCNFG